jgi:O-succinylbenzoate synthase
MQFDRLEFFHVALPLLRPWRTAYGEDAVVESVLVCATGSGATAWAESCPLAAPCYSPEWAGGVFHTLVTWLAPHVIGRDFPTAAALHQALAPFKGNPFAKAALDLAWHSLAAVQAGLPLHRFLGAERSRHLCGADFGVGDSLDQLVRDVGAALEAGHPRVKLKFRPGWDLDMLRAVRTAFPTATLHIDCNAGYRRADLPLLQRLDEFDLAMIEQPLAHDDLVDHARLAERIATPICLDESIASVDRARQALELGACRWINIKPARLGGIAPSLEVIRLARDRGVGLWIGGMLESAIGVRACLALSLLDGFTYPGDLFPSSTYYAEELGRPAIEFVPGAGPWIEALDRPGLGTEPDQTLLERFTRHRAVIEPGARTGTGAG